MARKITPTAKATTPARAAAKAAPVSTPVRNTPIPKAAVAAKKPAVVVTHELIARRAYDIFLSGTGGSEHENWLRAERELRGNL